MDKLHIVFATDDGYLTPTLIAAASSVLRASDRTALKIVVLDTGITESKWVNFKTRLRAVCGDDFELLRHVVDTKLYADFKSYKGSLGTYARLDIPQIFPDLPWCVYADGDTLFLDDPLKLRDVYDARYAIQGQPDSENWDYDEKGVPSKQHWFEGKGLGWDSSQYVCAGFLLMNLDWFRANDATRRCLDFLRDYPDCANHDQDALSLVCRGHVGFIADEWGRLSRNAFRGVPPACLHYAADAPWKLMTSRRQDYNDAHKLWFDFAKRHFGFEMADLLTDPFDAAIFRRKMLVRFVCKMIFPLFCFFGFPMQIGCFLHKHYIACRKYHKMAMV